MKKGQAVNPRIKKMLKFLKLNENTISSLMGGVVVILVAGLIFNYFRTANLKMWQGTLLNDKQAATTSTTEEKETGDVLLDTYIVVKGDDLWHIAEKYYKSGYNYVDIIKENNIVNGGMISVGQALKIPKVEPKKMTVAVKETGVVLSGSGDVLKSDQEGSISIGEYTISKGDSYWNIAVRAYGDGYKWTKIYWANKNLFTNPNIIHVGVKIQIPKLAE